MGKAPRATDALESPCSRPGIKPAMHAYPVIGKKQLCGVECSDKRILSHSNKYSAGFLNLHYIYIILKIKGLYNFQSTHNNSCEQHIYTPTSAQVNKRPSQQAPKLIYLLIKAFKKFLELSEESG